METKNVKIKLIHPQAKVPTYGTDGSACFDLYSCDAGVTAQNQAAIFDIGISFEIPEGYAMLVYSRSGHGFNNDVRLANCVGVIDSDYRDSVKVKLTSDNRAFGVNVGDRIAQACIVPVPRIQFDVVEELSDTERGTGGFGSTGA